MSDGDTSSDVAERDQDVRDLDGRDTEVALEPDLSLTEDNPDFAFLSKEEYARYFDLLERVWAALIQGYELDSEDSFEARSVRSYLERLLHTARALRMKYTHRPSDQRTMWVDLDDSGLPNAQEINNVAVDLLHRRAWLLNLPAEAMLKQRILDYMFKYHEEPVDALWQLAQRTYLKMLEKDKVFLPFMLEDSLEKQPPTRKDMRTYLLSWACYDFTTSRPYLHVMSFDQNNEDAPLENREVNFTKLSDLLRTEGSRVPDVGILAMAVDDALESVHPKILKRIGLGPLFTPLLLEQEGLKLDDKHRAVAELLARYGKEDDFIFVMSDEIVFSKSQRISSSMFSNGRVREVFHIPENDPDSYARRASVVHKHALMPHLIAQHLDDELVERVPELQGARILTYDASGRVHGA